MAENRNKKSMDKIESSSKVVFEKMSKIDEGAVSKGAPTSSFPGFKDFNDFSQLALKTLMLSIKNSNALPSEGDDFDYYSSFYSVNQELSRQSTRLLDKIQDTMRYHGLRGNVSANNDQVDIDERFDVLVDANDQLLERVGTFLDEASGLKKDLPLIVVSKTPKMSAANNWNKSDSNTSTGAANVSFKLFTAKNITRSQLSFKDKIDNSCRPFVPKITDKPNALKPLEECLVVPLPEDHEDVDPNFSYPHPYQFELDHFNPPAHQVIRVEPQSPSSMDVEPLYIDEEEDLRALCKTLKTVTEIAVDLEHHSYRSFLGFTCLMQLSTRTNDYIIDTLALRHELHILNDVFTDPNIVKVFHGADMDILWLQRDFGLYVVNMFDTGQASRVLGFAKFSLAYLLDFYCQVTADKQYQMADWRIRPLPQEFLKYAREDTHYLLYIYDRLKNDLIDADKGQNSLMSTVIIRSTQLCGKKYTKPSFTDSTYKEIHRESKKTFNSKQMNALKGLTEWRDRIARQEDESTGFVLRNHMMIQMAEILPRETGGVLACCNPLPPLVRQHASDLQLIIKEASVAPLQQVVQSKPAAVLKPSSMQHPKYNIDVLTCPHDLSRPDATHTVEKSLPNIDIGVSFRDTSNLFFETNDSTKASSRKRKALRKTAELLNSFANPFLKYLPEDLALTEIKQAGTGQVAAAKQEETIWKLLPDSVKVVEVKPAPVLQVIKTSSRLAFSPGPEEEDTPHGSTLRQQVSEEKRTSQQLQAVSSEVVSISSLTKMKKKGKKRKSEEAAEMERETFTPQVYNQEEFNALFQGESNKSTEKKNKKRKKKEYNPGDTSTADSDFKAAAKPRLGQTNSSNKSLTYTAGGPKSSSTPKIQWPGR